MLKLRLRKDEGKVVEAPGIEPWLTTFELAVPALEQENTLTVLDTQGDATDAQAVSNPFCFFVQRTVAGKQSSGEIWKEFPVAPKRIHACPLCPSLGNIGTTGAIALFDVGIRVGNATLSLNDIATAPPDGVGSAEVVLGAFAEDGTPPCDFYFDNFALEATF